MFLTKIVVSLDCALSFRSFSKAISSLVVISILAASMPAAPRTLVDAANGLPAMMGSLRRVSLEEYGSTVPTGDPQIPAFDTAPLALAFNSTLEFAADVRSMVMPTNPAGLENAKIPTFGERANAFVAKSFRRVGLSSVPKSSSASPRLGGVNATPPQPTSVVDFDFDNDGKADVGRWHTANTEFKVRNSNGGSYSAFTVGSSSSIAAPGDFNGDGKTDAAVFNAGTWKYKTSTGATEQTITFGTTGDIPVAGDYDGDGTTDAAVYRPSTNTWWINKSSGGTTNTTFGAANDIVAPGDYDGDGKNDLALYRPSAGDWHITPSSTGTPYSFHWGISSDTPVPADYDGDGKTDPAVFRTSTGTWYVYKSFDGTTGTQAWGSYKDQPVPADYDGDSKADFAIWRPTTGIWYIVKSSDASYEYHSLGVPGDTAVPSAYLKQVGGSVSGDALNAARLAPKNATGGTDLYSQNFSWGTSLVSLPGRAGLDAGLGISYNSLVWTKVGSAMVFDPDYSNASPGFRFGLPTIEPIYYDDEKDVWAYMMVTPSGARVQFRQTAVTNVFETADSSYSQLVVNGATHPNDASVENLTITVRTTDGTQMSYVWSLGAYRCTQIKDRNGNYITLAYDGDARLSTVTDTLGRVITVTYDSTTNYPSTINFPRYTNNGNGSLVTAPWVSFSYTTKTVDTDFHTDLTVVGPPDGTVMNVLDKITYADGSSTKFDYNGYLQVKKVSTIAADSSTHVLNSVETNLASPGTSRTDCPRLTSTSTVTESFNSGNPVTVTNTLTTGVQAVDIDGNNVAASMIQVALQNHPNGNITNTYVHDSGWKEGLPIRVDDYANGNGLELKRSSWMRWTQDDTGLTYTLNPRVTETKVSDGANTKKTAIEYRLLPSATIAEYGLVNEVSVLDGSSNVLKRVETDYNLSSTYTSRRIIGLPSEVRTYEGTNTSPVSKVAYAYDDGTFSEETNQIITATRHDSTNYGSTFIAGRGNLTSTTRHDVTAALAASVSKVRYDIAGSPVSQLDPRDRKTTIDYTDNFNTTPTAATFAYPKTITDPGGNSSTIQYRFDLGANIWARSPKPEGGTNSFGKTTSRIYSETTGRLTRQTIENTGAYTRYDYPNTGNKINTYTTVVDITGVGTIDSSDEVLSETILDGAGRVIKTRTENPNSTGGYAGTRTDYDLAGRVIRQSVPTEINSSWNPSGDDSRGTDGNGNPIWLWNEREYDWMNRVTREINTDGTDKLYTYTGCGCAGGLVTTIKGELTDAFGMNDQLQTGKRRTQKIYQDILGRVEKKEVWDLDGAALYSTIENEYNGRDQITRITESSTQASQETTFEFDGHGRLKKSHKPENRDSSNNLTYTTLEYNADDTIKKVTDPRGAETIYTYGNKDDSSSTEYRALLTKIAYTSPNTTNIPAPTDVILTYDAAGNRKYMSDESGNVTYAFDELSRLTSETKVFAGTLVNAPPNGYKLEYTYHLSGGIKSIKDPDPDPDSPNGWEVTYASDKTGRTTSIGAPTGFPVSSFASSISYRAFGGVKLITYSTSSATNVTLTYDDRLRPATYEAESSANTTDIHNKTYTYNNDGSIKLATNTLDANYSQKYEYDFAARLKMNKMGGVVSGASKYDQSLGYDAFSNLTSRSTTFDGTTRSFTATYANNRKDTGGFGEGDDTFDSAGNVVLNIASYTPVDIRKWKFDAAGRTADWEETTVYAGTTRWDQGEKVTFDGDGRPVKRETRSRQWASPPSGWVTGAVYHLYSSVLRQEIAELDSSGQWKKRKVYFNGSVIVEQTPGWGVVFRNIDPVAGSEIKTESSGEIMNPEIGRIERAGLGEVIPTTEPEVQQPPLDYWDKRGGTHNPQYGGCVNNQTQTLGMIGPMPCNPSESFVGYLQSVYGPNIVLLLQERRELGTGGRGADNEPHDGPRVPGLHVYPDGPLTKEWGIQRYSWIMSVHDKRGGPYITHPDRNRVRMIRPSWHEVARDFLRKNAACLSFIERLLAQLQADTSVRLEGNIFNFIDEMERSGTLRDYPAGSNSDGSYNKAHGEAYGVDYGNRGWGFSIAYQTHGQTALEMDSNNASVYVQELIHSIGMRGGVAYFSDDAIAGALYRMGIAITLDEFDQLPANVGLPRYSNGQIKYRGSRLWHPIADYMCGNLTSKPAGMR